MQSRTFRISICIVAVVSVAQCDIFSSTAHLQHLLHLERHMVTVLHDYVEHAERKIAYVRGYLDNFYESYNDVLTGNASITGEEMVDNPIQAFQLVKRLSVDWDVLRDAMEPNHWKPVIRLTKRYERLMPSEDDLHGAALALVRLQDTYRLDMGDLALGRIQGLKSGTGLTARDLLFLGKQSFNQGYYSHAIRWLQNALNRAKLEGNTTAGLNEIEPFLTSAIQVHDELFDRTDIDLANYDTFGYPIGHQDTETFGTFEIQKRRPLSHNNSLLEDQESYNALCRGETLRTPKQEAQLHCRFETRGNPFLFIQPVKAEQKSLDPYIVQFHGLLTDNQVETMRELAEPKAFDESTILYSANVPSLSRSLVQGTGGNEIVSLSRTSQNAWVGPKDHPLMSKIYKLVEIVTGLSTDVDSEHAEVVQIANYGMGGHYTPHYDYLLVDKTPEEMKLVHPQEKESGDRTATLMFYLSDVTRGGATVFPKIGAGVWPVKGSAVFWYNLKKSGQENEQTLHGACPVLHGSKWVANFWIREKGQTFRRRCDKNPDL